MKLLYFDDFRLGVLAGDTVVDVTSIVEDLPHRDTQDLMNGLIEHFDKYRARLDDAAKGQGTPLSKVRIRQPLPRPSTVDCMAVNYMEDGTRDAPAPINAFNKAPSTIIGHGDTMVLGDVPATCFEGEAELAVVIGKRADHVPADKAMNYIFGYTNFIDGSARGLPPPNNVFFQMKSRDTYTPIGPYLVTADEIADPMKMQISLSNNGTVMQNFNTDDMAHNISRCIEWISSIHVLLPGDIIATGTNHRGLNPFMDGDRIEMECEGLGTLAINIQDDLKRTWARVTRLEHAEKGLEGVHTPQLTGKYAKGESAGAATASSSGKRKLTSI
jgi:2-keto-4-pentenoate hydratase/2-oxohepta-3-ene-1,7-dioic acid hydratase in catechol pathway